jgi:uncharacterized protein
MLCPGCQTELKMTERQSIEIDYCPQCRGVWLDRGELDKIIERAQREERSAPPAAPEREREHRQPQRYRDEYYGAKPYRKKSLLSELLDF